MHQIRQHSIPPTRSSRAAMRRLDQEPAGALDDDWSICTFRSVAGGIDVSASGPDRLKRGCADSLWQCTTSVETLLPDRYITSRTRPFVEIESRRSAPCAKERTGKRSMQMRCCPAGILVMPVFQARAGERQPQRGEACVYATGCRQFP